MTDPTEPAEPAEPADAAVRYAVADGVATVTLNRPDQRNPLNAETLTSLLAALQDAATDGTVRAVVLTGTGNTFCSGADLRGAAADGTGFAASGPRLTVAVLEALLDHPRPTIARVQGHVAGGGNGLVAACDLAVAVEHAKFAFSEVRVGVAPAVVSVVCLRVMRPREAAELMLTGSRVPAARAMSAGLLSAVVPAEQLDACVGHWCEALLFGGPAAVAATKQLLRRVPGLRRDEAFEYTAELSARLFASDEATEGMAAFVERRPASWTTNPPRPTGR